LASYVPLYDFLAADYDRFVNWEARLSHELPFLDALFKEHSVHSVLDAACGSGQHAIGLAKRGYKAAGTDLSGAMIEKARQNAKAEGADVTFTVAGLGELATLGRMFDGGLCLGNSLPHLLSAEAVGKALADFAAVLRPGGLLVIQNRNFDQVWTRRERFMAPQAHREEAGEWLFLRFYDFHAETVTFNMIHLRRTEQGWTQHVESTELRPVFRDDLAAALAASGFERITFYGNYEGSSFDPEQSGDLIAVALKTA
jgi:SAM-dependent methyltransferase